MNREKYDQQFLQFRDACVRGGLTVPRADQQIAVLDEDGSSHTSKDYSFDYLAHCAWAARMIAACKPQAHVDFGSYVYFSAIVSAFVPATFCDIRAFGTDVPGLRTQVADVTRIPFEDGSVESASCLHVMDHLGLGRYGDHLDAFGDRKGASELKRIVARGGMLLIVVPMNREPRVNYNAHRIYSYAQIAALFDGMRFFEHRRLDGFGREVWGDEPFGDYTGCFAMVKP